MTRTAKYVLPLALVVAVALAAVRPQAWTAAQDGQTVRLAVGETATLTLDAAGGTGYSWTAATAEKAVALVSEPEVIVGGAPGMVGGPVQYVFTVSGVASGETKLTARLVRPWQPDQPAKSLTLTVQVAAGKI